MQKCGNIFRLHYFGAADEFVCAECELSGGEDMSESALFAPNGRLKVPVKLNAFYILGNCMKAMREAGWNIEEVDGFRELAMAGDYDNLLRVVSGYCEVD